MNLDSPNEVKPISTPKDAIAEFVGEQFIEWLMDYVGAQARAFPELETLQKITARPEKVRKFMLQRYIAANAFVGHEGEPGFLGFAIANLSESDDPEAESALEILEKKLEEEVGGQTKPTGRHDHHKQLWQKLLHALGATDEEISRAEPKEWTRNYIAELSDLYSNGEWQEVAGAFSAHERAIPEEYSALTAFLRSQTQVSDSDLEVLTWHAGVDFKYVINTGHILEKIVFDPGNKELIWQGVSREFQIRRDFLAGLLQHLTN
ncbi:MAG TPA: iron-containing redox enzyme family protein [Patescibacteria group bacterium]|nr:iron-containing redox enzyme family protein [Patescibacteria group bacterium]